MSILHFPTATSRLPFCTIPLSLALLCLECQTVFSSPAQRQNCVICHSTAVVPLSSVIDLDPEPPDPPAMLLLRPQSPTTTSTHIPVIHLVRLRESAEPTAA
jgi:hypothetical protein